MITGGMSSGGDVVAPDGLKPWWRSLGMVLGLPGLVFLIWVWVDSMRTHSMAGAFGHVRAPHGFVEDYWSWKVGVGYGKVVVFRKDPHEMTRGMTLQVDWPGFYRRGVLFNDRRGVWWGAVRWSEQIKVDGAGPVSVMVSERWFSFGFVVLAYVMVWLGSLALWRWWMRRRWERERVLEE